MNTICLKRSDKNALLTDSKLSIYNWRSDTLELTFYKQNKHVISILNDIFPKVLSAIVMKYCKNIITATYNVRSYSMQLTIPEYDYRVNLSWTLIDKECVNTATFNIDIFGIDKHTVLYSFNEFMRRYYDKISYFPCIYSEYIPKPQFTNRKILKYCIVITKIITDILLQQLKK